MDDRNELFGDDDDFGFDDDLFGAEEDDFGDSDEFDFGDDDDFGGDEFDDFGFEDEEDDLFFEDDEEEEGGGASRTFVLLAALMIIFFIIGLLAVIVLATREGDVDPFDATSTFVAEVNATTIAQNDANNTQIAIEQSTATSVKATEFAELTASAATEFAQQTQAALTEQAQQTQIAVNATSTAVAEIARQTLEASFTQTAEAEGPVATQQPVATEPPSQVTTVGVSGVELTATAIAEQFLALTPGGDGTPTQEAVATDDGTGGGATTGTGGPTVTRPPGTLPQTGFLDENLGVLALMAFGLMGVIFASRRLRALNS